MDRITWHVCNNANTYYFSVVDILDDQVKVTSYGGIASPYAIVDWFFINSYVNAAINLLLMD